jgi:hypothetical protein
MRHTALLRIENVAIVHAYMQNVRALLSRGTERACAPPLSTSCTTSRVSPRPGQCRTHQFSCARVSGRGPDRGPCAVAAGAWWVSS